MHTSQKNVITLTSTQDRNWQFTVQNPLLWCKQKMRCVCTHWCLKVSCLIRFWRIWDHWVWGILTPTIPFKMLGPPPVHFPWQLTSPSSMLTGTQKKTMQQWEPTLKWGRGAQRDMTGIVVLGMLLEWDSNPRTHDPCNPRAVSYQLDYQDCPVARGSSNPMFWQRVLQRYKIDVNLHQG